MLDATDEIRTRPDPQETPAVLAARKRVANAEALARLAAHDIAAARRDLQALLVAEHAQR